jgi:polyisoprenoid-binding protein YceI
MAALVLPLATFGQQMVVDFDAAAGQINWTLVGNVHTVHGTFHLKQGHVNINRSNGDASGELVVDAASGESGNSARDKRMRKEVLETDKFPDVRLKVSRLEGPLPVKQGATIHLLGQFVIHGGSHEVSIPLEVSVVGAEVTCKGKFVVPYVDWGMKDPSNFLFKVNKTVEIELRGVGHMAPK